MLRRARLWDCMSSVRLSVCDFEVCFSHRLEYFENNFTAEQQKVPIVSTPTWAMWSNGNTPKIRVESGWGQLLGRKPAISLKQGKIWPRLLWRPNRKSHTRFRLVTKSMTLDDRAAASRVNPCDSTAFLSFLVAGFCPKKARVFPKNNGFPDSVGCSLLPPAPVSYAHVLKWNDTQ